VGAAPPKPSATAGGPPAEVTIDARLVQTLLLEQHPDLAQLAPTQVGEGWDNAVFRLGDDLAVRQSKISYEESGRLLQFYEEGLQGYTYLEDPKER